MACCVLATLIIAQVLLIWGRLQRLLGLKPHQTNGLITPHWSPYVDQEITGAGKAGLKKSKWSICLLSACMFVLLVGLGATGGHILQMYQSSGFAFLSAGVSSEISDAARCNVSVTPSVIAVNIPPK